MENFEEVIKVLIDKASKATYSADSIRFSQSALNVANTYSTFKVAEEEFDNK